MIVSALFAVKTFAADTLSFVYIPLPDKVCYCDSAYIDRYNRYLGSVADSMVMVRRKIKPARTNDKNYQTSVGDLAGLMVAERAALKRKADVQYRKKIEPLYYSKIDASAEEKKALDKKISEEKLKLCKKYSSLQTKMIEKHIKQMSEQSDWFAQFSKNKTNMQYSGSVTLTDFDLYFMYLETMSSAFNYVYNPLTE